MINSHYNVLPIYNVKMLLVLYISKLSYTLRHYAYEELCILTNVFILGKVFGRKSKTFLNVKCTFF